MYSLSRNSIRHYLLTVSLVALLGLPASLLAQSLSDTPWTEYFGASHGPYVGWGHTSRIQNDRTGQIRKTTQAGRTILFSEISMVWAAPSKRTQ